MQRRTASLEKKTRAPLVRLVPQQKTHPLRILSVFLFCIFFVGITARSQADDIIDRFSGRLSLRNVDLSVAAGGLQLELERVYVSGSSLAGLLGSRWRLNWEDELLSSDAVVMVLTGGGALEFEQTVRKNEMIGPSGERLVLEDSGRARLYMPDGRRSRFGPDGRLEETEDANGNKALLHYGENGYLAGIEGPGEAALTVSTNDRGNITRILATDGNEIKYAYDGSELKSVIVNDGPPVSYFYSDNGDLIGIDRADTGSVRLTYNDHHQVTARSWADGSQEFYEHDENGLTMRHIDAAGNATFTRRSPDGRRSETTDPLGNKTVIEYNSKGLPETVTGPAGNRSFYRYDGLGRLAEIGGCCGITRFAYVGNTNRYDTIHEADGRKFEFDYDDRGNLLRIKRNGSVFSTLSYYPNGLLRSSASEGSPGVSYTYFSNGLVRSTTDAAGNETVYRYDRRGNRIRETNGLGDVTVWKYDRHNRMVAMIDPPGAQTRYAYDDAGRLSEIVAPGDRKTRYDYDGRGRLTAVTDPAGRAVRYQYDSAGRLVAETGPGGGTYRYQHDALGNVIAETNPLGGRTSRRFDALGRVVEETEPGGRTWRYTYSDAGLLLEAADSRGYVVKHSYDRIGRRTESVDAAGAKTRYRYDGLGRVTEIVHPDGHRRIYEYDRNGRVFREKDNRGLDVMYTYDPLGRITGEKWAGGLQIEHRYDALDNRLGWRDSLGGSISYQYTARGLLSQERDAAGAASRFYYDPAARLAKTVDPLGNATTMSYNAAGDLTERASPGGDRVVLQYGPDGNLTRVVGPSGGAVSLHCDAAGNLVRKTDPLGAASRYVYDEAGRLVSATDPNGRTTTYAYDPAGNLVRKRLADGTVLRYAYDPEGRMIEADDGKFPMIFAYDGAGLLKEIHYPAIKRRLGYAYDKTGRLSRFTDSEGREFDYGYSDTGLLASITPAGGRAITFEYDPKGRLVLTSYPNGVTAKRTYDVMDRSLSITCTDSNDRVLAGWQYAYDAAGNLVRVTDSEGNGIQYAYDGDGRLTEERRSDGTLRYGYLPGGNRGSLKSGTQTVTYRYNRADQLLQAGEQSFEYDLAGNLVRRTGPGGTTTYRYNAENQLAGVTLPDGREISFGYAPTGERIWRQDREGTAYFVTDGTNLLAELDQTLEPRATYLHGPGIDEPLMRETGDGLLYYHADYLGSVRALTDAGGKIQATYETDAFGNHLKQAQVENPFTFTGREFDPALGLYFYRARHYDPRTGRFISKDPLDPVLRGSETLNPYIYVHNSPTRFTDPTGLLELPFSEIKKLAAKLRPIHPSEVQMPGRADPGQQLPRPVRGDPRLADYAQPGVRHYRRVDFPSDTTGGDPLLADLVKKPPRPRPPGGSRAVGNRNVTARGGGMSPSQEIRRVDYAWGRGNATGRRGGVRTRIETSGASRTPSTRILKANHPAAATPSTEAAPVGPTPPSQSAPVNVQHQPGPAWNPSYKGPTGRNRGPDMTNWQKLQKNPATGDPSTITEQVRIPVIHFLVTTEQILKCRDQKIPLRKCVADIIVANAAWAAVQKMVLASGGTKAVIVLRAASIGAMYFKLAYDTGQLLYNMSSWLAAEYERREAEERHERFAEVNLEARLDEDIEAMRRLIVDTLEPATLARERACKEIRGMLEKAEESAAIAKKLKTEIPALADTYEAWLRAVEQCDLDARKHGRLRDILDRNQRSLDALRARLQKAADIAATCRSKPEADNVRRELKSAEDIGADIAAKKDEARELARQLGETLEALAAIKVKYRDALAARDNIIQLAGELPTEEALTGQITAADAATRTLVEEGERLEKRIDLLRKGYPDELEPEVEKKFKNLKWLIYEYQSRGACGTPDLRRSYNGHAGELVQTRLTVENKLKPFIDRHEDIEACPSDLPNTLVESIIETKVESETLLARARDVGQIADECASAADRSKVAVTLSSLRPLVDHFAEVTISGDGAERRARAPKPLKIKAGQQITLSFEYTVSAPPGSVMNVRIEPSYIGWVRWSEGSPRPLKLPPIVNRFRMGDRQKRQTFKAALPLQIPYPSIEPGQKETGISPHELLLDVFADNRKLYTLKIWNAFDVRGPGTDFNGTGNLRVCVLEADGKSPYDGNVRITIAGASQVTKTFSGATCVMGTVEAADFDRIPLGAYKVRAEVLDDADSYQGPRTGTSAVTLFRWNPQDRHVEHPFGATVVLGKGSKKPRFIEASRPEPDSGAKIPRQWTINVNVVDRKNRGISGARVFTADGAMTGKHKERGRYVIGPIKNVEKLEERSIEVVADISFRSPFASPLMNQRVRTVELKDETSVEVTIQFDIVVPPAFIGATGSGDGKPTGGGGGGGAGEDRMTQPATPPAAGGGGGKSGSGTKSSGRPAAENQPESRRPAGGVSGGSQIGAKRPRDVCIKLVCKMCGELLFGMTPDEECMACVASNEQRIQRCMEGYKNF